jgi:amidase
MNLAEYASYDGLGLAELVRRKEIAPRELCHLALQAIEKLNPQLNAVIETFPERAGSAMPNTPGPFLGVPFLVKDFPIEAGTKAEIGSQLAAGLTPERDTELMLRFRRAGFINLGRTTTSEFGLAALTVSRQSGATCNPWDPSRSTAGSSGGSAAAVAAGIVPLASGGDGGGSIRNPASFCGLVGLKPTRGRISLGPDTGDPYSGMVVGFALTRSVRDCAAVLDAVEGPLIGDPFEIPRPVTPYLTETANAPGHLRIAVTTRSWSGVALDPEVAAAVAATATLLQQLGHTVIEDAPDFDYDTFLAAQIDLWLGHTAAFIDAVAQAVGRVPSEQNLQSTTFATYVAGKDLPATRLIAAEEYYNVITRQVAQFLANYDLLLTPTNTCLPLPLDAHQLDAPGATVQDLFNHLAPIETFTALFNGTGHPAMSLPLQVSRADLPIGMQFVAGFGQEAVLFRLAAALEATLPWHQRRPKLHASR